MSFKIKAKNALHTISEFSYFLIRRARNDTIFRVAASLSYTSLIAIVPLFAIGLSIFSAFPAFESIRDQIQEMLLRNLAPTLGNEVSAYFADFLKASAGLTTIGVISIVVTSIMLLSTIENSFNFIFRVSRPRHITTKITLYWTVITLGPLLLGAAFSIRSYFFALPGLSAENIDASILLSMMLPALMTIIVLMIIYIFVPNKKVRFTNAACGALIAMLLFAILRKCFGMTVQASAAYQTLYGALAIIPIFLVWMYSAWSVVIFGAVVTAALDDFQDMDRRSLKKSIVLNDPEKRDFVKNHPSRKKLLQKEQN